MQSYVSIVIYLYFQERFKYQWKSMVAKHTKLLTILYKIDDVITVLYCH